MAFRKLSWNCYEALETDEQQPDFPRKKKSNSYLSLCIKRLDFFFMKIPVYISFIPNFC